MLGDGENTQEDEEIKSNKANNVLFYVDLCFSETDPLSFLAFFPTHTHPLFFPFFAFPCHTHSLYLIIANSRPETVSETGQNKIIPSVAHACTHARTHARTHTDTQKHRSIHTHAVHMHSAHHTEEAIHKNICLVWTWSIYNIWILLLRACQDPLQDTWAAVRRACV